MSPRSPGMFKLMAGSAIDSVGKSLDVYRVVYRLAHRETAGKAGTARRGRRGATAAMMSG